MVVGGGCSYGSITERDTGARVGNAFVSFRLADMSTTAGGPVALGSIQSVNTWDSSMPGSNNGQGLYYLNDYGTKNAGDTKDTFIERGWNRFYVSKPGFDTRRIYRNHQYTPTCTISTGKNPYSAGPYPYDTSGPSAPNALCAAASATLQKSTVNYVSDPDIVVDLRALRDNQVSTECEGVTSRCLRVSVRTANASPGDLWVVAPANNLGSIRQRRMFRNGGYTETALNGRFVDHPGHGHIHFQGWTHLRLRNFDSTCDSEGTAEKCAIARNGQKVSFCLTETNTFDSAYKRDAQPSYSCTVVTENGVRMVSQGIGAGMADTYNRQLSGQMIDIAGLPSGKYWLEVEVNPDKVIYETEYTNNVTRLAVTL